MDPIDLLLTRGVEKIYPSKEELEKVLRSGRKLKLYQGFDPTGTQLHIGHMVGLRKLKQWQDLGHQVIFVIGDGTGQAGDPSGKTTGRGRFFTREELRENAKDYVMQAGRIVRFDGENPVDILYNGDWLNKLTLVDLLNIAGHFSYQQLTERDLYKERMQKGEALNFREVLYPLLQGYDSVSMKIDLEIGGTDQMFNMLIGRQLVKAYLNKEKFVMTTPLLTDSQGAKIGKTEGNVIALTDKPEDLFAKIMALGDDVVIKALEYLTDVSSEELKTIEEKLKAGENPISFKKKLAFEVVRQLNNGESAQKAQEEFERVIQKHELPSEITEITLGPDDGEFIDEDFFVSINLASSKAGAKRLFEQGGIEINGKRITDPKSGIQIKNDMVVRVGKRKIVKLKIG